MSSATGGQLVFNYNTFLQRGLNLLDVADLPTARANLGISSANGLNIGSGLLPSGTTFNFSAPVNLSVNSSTTGTASTIAQYDTSGSLTSSGYVNVGYGTVPTTSVLNFNAGTTGALASITRGAGTNGALTITNSGTGGLVLGATSLNGGLAADTLSTSGVLNVALGTTPVASTVNFNSGTSSALGSLSRSTGTNGGMLLTNTGTGGITLNGSLLSFVSSGIVSSVSATSTSLTSATGTTIGLSAGATGSTSLTVNSTGSAGAGNQALAVSGGATIDTMTVSGAVSANGGLTVPSGQTLTVNGTIAGSAYTGLTTLIGNKLDLTTTSAQSVASAVTFAKPLTLSTQPSWSVYTSTSSTTLTTGANFTVNATQMAGTRNITIVGTGQVQATVAGRYAVTLTGQVSGSGSVILAVIVSGTETDYTVWSGTTATNISCTFLLDMAVGTTVQPFIKATTGTFTIQNSFFSGYMIG